MSFEKFILSEIYFTFVQEYFIDNFSYVFIFKNIENMDLIFYNLNNERKNLMSFIKRKWVNLLRVLILLTTFITVGVIVLNKYPQIENNIKLMTLFYLLINVAFLIEPVSSIIRYYLMTYSKVYVGTIKLVEVNDYGLIDIRIRVTIEYTNDKNEVVSIKSTYIQVLKSSLSKDVIKAKLMNKEGDFFIGKEDNLAYVAYMNVKI